MSRKNIKAIILGIASLLAIFPLVWTFGVRRILGPKSMPGTTFDPDTSFRGRIAVTVIERETGPGQTLKFMIDLDQGEISAFSNPQFAGPLSPGGRIDYPDCARGVKIPAPDNKLAAHCALSVSQMSVKILDLKSGVQVREWPAPKEWGISGLIWSTDSKSLAVLLEKGRMDFGPTGLLSAASGHPISLETFSLELLSVQSGHEMKLPVIRKDSPSGWARIDWIQ